MNKASFLADVAQYLGCDARRSEGVTFVVFQELRHRLPAKEVGDVAAQLPADLRRLWEDESGGAERRTGRIGREEFLGRIRIGAGLPDDHEAERAARAVFRALQKALGSPHGREGEAWDVLSVLPKDLKLLWLAAAESPAPDTVR